MTGSIGRRRICAQDQAGFTLIEILIVVILLGILAMVIVPQVSVSTDDAKLNTLTTNLGNVRSAIELYYYQHNNTYPGANNTSGTGAAADPGEAATAFAEQLTQFTAESGATSVSKTATHKFGPYLKGRSGLPINPFTDNKNDVTCDIAETDITARTADTGDKAWKFYTQTGVFIANHSTEHDDY